MDNDNMWKDKKLKSCYYYINKVSCLIDAKNNNDPTNCKPVVVHQYCSS